MDKIIEVKNLQKSYKGLRAVKGISFYAERGKLFSFLGPNGAGKSTTIDIICTLLQKDAGEVWVDGHELGKEDRAIRNEIGVVFQDNLLDNLLTVQENLMIRAGFYLSGKKEIKAAVSEAAKATEIESFFKRPYGKLSGGQRRRADIARALLSQPKILILDEPTTGLDPQTRQNVWGIIRKLQQEKGMTVFLTTHYMEEAAESDYIIVIDDGKIVAKGTPAELQRKYANDQLRLFSSEMEALEGALEDAGVNYTAGVDYRKIKLDDTLDALEILASCKEYINGFEVIRASMDDVFIGITGKEIRE